jgi:hypothetical protein
MLTHSLQKRKIFVSLSVAAGVLLGVGATTPAQALPLSDSSIRINNRDGVGVEVERRPRRRSPIELNSRDGRLDVDVFDRRRPETDVRVQGNDDGSFELDIERREPEPLLRFGIPVD